MESGGPHALYVDLRAGTVTVEDADGSHSHALGSPEGFAAVSRAWLRSGWDAKYVYRFTWLGRPVIQLPEDVLRLQELVWRTRPTLVVETGVAHGGSLVLHASVLHALGGGRVVGVDVDIRAHNRAAIEAHPLAHMIDLVEGDSTDPDTVARVRALTRPDDRVMVVLDSSHAYEHVRAELESYAPLVSPGSYVVAMDGLMEDLAGAPRTRAEWAWDNPARAAREFVAEHAGYTLGEPEPLFNEGAVNEPVTYARDGVIRRDP